MPRNEILKRVQDAIRHPFCFPGGYEKAIYMTDGGRICRPCALENYRAIAESTMRNQNDGWAVMGVDVYWEGPPDYCCNCGETMKSEYGDPEASDNE